MKVPRLVFINKMDKMGADFYESVKSIKDRLGVKAYPIQLPIGAEDNFEGVIDLLTRKAYHYDGGLDEKTTEVEIPSNMKDKVEEYRTNLIEAITEFDDALMEKYLEVKR